MEQFFESIAVTHPNRSRIVFVCIGSDRSTGDSFGPLVGTMLQERGWPHVIGTLQKPCDAHAVEHAAAAVSEDSIVIAIDACLGKMKSIGRYIVTAGPLQPGKAIGRRLPAIGHYSIAGVVNANGPKAYWMLQTTSLYLVMQMAKEVAGAIDAAWATSAMLPASDNNDLEIHIV
nr:spore protease YyaC [Paenibacillus prosopidis]